MRTVTVGIKAGGITRNLWVRLDDGHLTIMIVFLIVTAVKWLLGLRRNPAATDDALSIPAERSSKGQVTKERYEEIRKVL
ncbi:MAG: hypothetical protein MJE63_34060 [Proteobacteria bacterium]|nr:hypothetical protein [Pseudomonadota bacterium]